MYAKQLEQLRNVSEKIISGEFSSKSEARRQDIGFMSRPNQSEEEPTEESFFGAILEAFLETKQIEAEPAEDVKNTFTEEGEMRPVSRGQGFGSDTGYRLIEDMIDEFGLTRAQAAGFVGNLDYETGGFKFMQEIEPLVPGSRGGFGFAQWTGPRRKQFENWSKENSLDLASYEANKGYLFHELKNTSEGRVLDDLRATDNPEEAAKIVSEKFLRPGIPNLGQRIARASGYMEIE